MFDAVRGSAQQPPVAIHALDHAHPRVEVGVHVHRYLEIVYFRRGAGRHRVGGQDWVIEPGDLFVIPPAQPHDLRQMKESEGWAVEFSLGALTATSELRVPLELWWSNPLLSAFLGADQQSTSQRIHTPRNRRPVLEQLLTELQRELARREVGYRSASTAHLVVLLVTIARLAADLPHRYRREDDPLLAACFESIERQFRGPLSVSGLAEALAVSPGHLTTIVRRRTGRTLLDWITDRRMAEARRLLVTSDLPIEAVARKVGYDDAAYFNRRFRQLHGRPPGAWRREAQSP
ncbi:AraC family transcriptional regulator [Pseudonocardia kujensis]|uniref:AraC family transcriptional regulator n=1 Tax=Pseudonocardia kujensis TaxID=1128675 RepID=UPI001E4159A7|nr:AraC family transcriptional regulator [Pseudonocardia kujensis]MCE0764173.1 AraC family transcriptional regulator [Pseudonocardia kujensis]